MNLESLSINKKTLITVDKKLLKNKLSNLIDIFNSHPVISNQWQILKNNNKDAVYFEFDNGVTTIQAKRIISLI